MTESQEFWLVLVVIRMVEPLVVMFNTLSKHLFASQSLLKERRRSPTGELREACKE